MGAPTRHGSTPADPNWHGETHLCATERQVGKAGSAPAVAHVVDSLADALQRNEGNASALMPGAAQESCLHCTRHTGRDHQLDVRQQRRVLSECGTLLLPIRCQGCVKVPVVPAAALPPTTGQRTRKLTPCTTGQRTRGTPADASQGKQPQPKGKGKAKAKGGAGRGLPARRRRGAPVRLGDVVRALPMPHKVHDLHQSVGAQRVA